MHVPKKQKPLDHKRNKINGIKVKGSDGSDYILSMVDIAMDKATKHSDNPREARKVMAAKILPEFAKAPEKAREWAKKMVPEKMNFIKVGQAKKPSNEELAKEIDKGEIG